MLGSNAFYGGAVGPENRESVLCGNQHQMFCRNATLRDLENRRYLAFALLAEAHLHC